MSKIKIVAEIGCNHNGSFEMAMQMVDAAKEAGADAVKFQSFVAEELVSEYAPKAEYQKKNDGEGTSQLEMLRGLQLSDKEYEQIKAHAEEIGIEIFSAPFDMTSVEALERVGQSCWKIPSGEITNLPYLERIRDIKCPNKEIILSTGMSSFDEVDTAVKLLEGSADTTLVILHCNTAYPTEDWDMNILAMRALKKRYPHWKVGLSDHSIGEVAAVVAASLGAEFIEKHFTLDKDLPGPDHKASADPKDMKRLCEKVRRAEVMLGREDKFVTNSEAQTRDIARKSITAKKYIKKGEIFTADNITCKRPGTGISPMHWHEVIGTCAEQDFAPNDLIRCSKIK